MKASPEAAARLARYIEVNGPYVDADKQGGETDCPGGCQVELDGCCPHGYASAYETWFKALKV